MFSAEASLNIVSSVGCFSPSSIEEMYFRCKFAWSPRLSCVIPAFRLISRSTVPNVIERSLLKIPPKVGRTLGSRRALSSHYRGNILFDCATVAVEGSYGLNASYEAKMSDPTQTLLRRHPNIFHGRWPGTDEGLPIGWISTVSTFFTFLESNCTQAQLASLVVEDISEQDGCLALIYRFGTPLRKDQIDIVGARAFFTRNRCAVGCIDCGKIVEELPESGAGGRCQACTCSASGR